jgi:hydroxyacylglutathione hydrolase
VVDPAEAPPVLNALEDRGWQLSLVLNTHHHWDHVGGNLALKARTGCRIVGSTYDRDRIPGIDLAVEEGETVDLGGVSASVMSVPGHTLGHLAYWFAEDDALFCGDTLFALGCGRLFEGTAEQMWTSLSKIRVLPEATRVYCAHEYTQANARFAITIEPANAALAARKAVVDNLRDRGRATVPSTLADELETNPFLRPESLLIRQALGLQAATDAEVFAEVRRRKDGFRG